MHMIMEWTKGRTEKDEKRRERMQERQKIAAAQHRMVAIAAATAADAQAHASLQRQRLLQNQHDVQSGPWNRASSCGRRRYTHALHIKLCADSSDSDDSESDDSSDGDDE